MLTSSLIILMILLSIDFMLIQNTDYGLGARLYDLLRILWCYIIGYMVIGLSNISIYFNYLAYRLNTYLDELVSVYDVEDEE